MSTDNSSIPPAQGARLASPVPQFVAPSADTSLSESLITLRKRRFVVILGVLLGVALGLYKSVTQVKLYTASGRIQVRTGSSNEYKLSSVGSLGDDPQRKMMTEVAILTSDTLLTTVARDLNLANNQTFLRSKTALPHQNLDDPLVRNRVLGRLKAGLEVGLVPKTDIVRISYTSLSAKLSADIVNKLITDYIGRSYETRYEATARVSRWLGGQLDDLKQQVEASQNQMLDLQRRLGVLGFDSQHNQIATTSEASSKPRKLSHTVRPVTV